MIAGKVREINYDSTVEGPRRALSIMLNREVRAKELWHGIKQLERNPKADDLLWRLLHAKVKVGSEIDRLLPEQKVCPYCKDERGNNVNINIPHVWIECKAAKEVWNLFAGGWERLQGRPPKFLPNSKDRLIALFAKCPYKSEATKSSG